MSWNPRMRHEALRLVKLERLCLWWEANGKGADAAQVREAMGWVEPQSQAQADEALRRCNRLIEVSGAP